MKYVIVTRVSDIKQEEGTSPETQFEDCLKYIKDAKYVHFHDTGKGGIALKKRKILLEAIDTLEKGDVLLAPRADRLSRSGETMALIKYMVKERKATIEYADGTKISLGDNASDWLQTKMLETLAEYERLVLSSRIRRAHKHKKALREVMGRVPYGYKNVNGKLKEDSRQQEILAKIRFLRDSKMTYREIALWLNERGFYNCYNRPWHYPNIYRIMKKEKVAQQESLRIPA